MPDIIITPGSGLIDFYPSAKTASIFTSGNDLALSNPSGNFEIISGNLGINTTVPSGRLTVVGSGLFSTRATPLSPSGSTTGIIPNALLHLYSATTGDTVFNVEGTNGSLFSVVDSLSGVLMSVNNNAGLPVFEVYSDDKIIGGRFNQNDFVVSSGGNTGLGIAIPSGKLHIVGNTIVSGNIGIGTTSPAYKLDIVGTGNINGNLYTSGNVGIGTTTPSGKLDVRGSIFLIGGTSNRFYIHNTGSATAFTYNSIYADSSDSLTLIGGDNSIVLAGQGGRVTIDAFSSEVDIGNSYNANSANQYIRFTPANTEAVRITNSGNVGIGITAPSGKLHVASGNIHLDAGIAGNQRYVQFGIFGTNTRIADDADSNRTYITTRGNSLDILNNAGTTYTATLRAGIVAGGSTSGNNLVLKSTTASGVNDYISLAVGNNGGIEAIRINSSGNVGIRTSSPSATLHVNGSGFFASGCSVTGVLNVQVIKSPIASGTDGTGIITFDMNQANVHTLRLGGNRTLAVSNVSIGQRFTIRLKQDTSPPRTVTWFSGITWPQNRVPTLTRTANAVDVFSFISTASGKYDGFIVGYNFPNA